MNLLDNVKNQLDRGIKVFNTTAPGSENIAFKEEVFEEINGNNHKIIIKDTPEPVIIPFLAERGNGTAVIVIPGGAFRRQVVNLEGIDVAKWLNSLGISAFVLLHRLPANDFPNREDVTLIDGQRAVRFVRANAENGISTRIKSVLWAFRQEVTLPLSFQPALIKGYMSLRTKLTGSLQDLTLLSLRTLLYPLRQGKRLQSLKMYPWIIWRLCLQNTAQTSL